MLSGCSSAWGGEGCATELLLHFHSAATQSTQQVWTADKRQTCKSPFCVSGFDRFVKVCLKKLEVIKAEQKRLLSTFRKNCVWFSYCCLIILLFLLLLSVLADFFFPMKKNGFLFSPLFLSIQAFRKPEIEIGLY